MARTDIYRFTSRGEELIGYVADDDAILRLRWEEGVIIGRHDGEGRIYRRTQHDERELGTVTDDGVIHSHGLFEGGELGWLEADGRVVQGGLIFEEEEIGRVHGPDANAAAAALLLIFLPDEAEANRHMMR